MPAPMTLAQAADLIDLSIQSVYKKHAPKTEENYKKYYYVANTEDYYEKDSSLSGFGEASRITDNAVIMAETPVQGFDRTYTQVFMGKLASFTMYDWKYGLKRRKLESVVKDLDESVRRKRERLTTGYLENSIGATTSYTVTDDAGNYSKSVVGGDSLALINNSHTREDGGTAWSNVITDGTTSNMDYEYDAHKAAYYTASLVVDPKGNIMDVDPKVFVFKKGSSISQRSQEILAAVKKNEIPGSADNDGSGVVAFSQLNLPYLTTTANAYWWAFDSSLMAPEMGLQYRESQGIVFEGPDTEFKTGTIYYKSTAAFDYGHNDGRNWYGSNGTNV